MNFKRPMTLHDALTIARERDEYSFYQIEAYITHLKTCEVASDVSLMETIAGYAGQEALAFYNREAAQIVMDEYNRLKKLLYAHKGVA